MGTLRIILVAILAIGLGWVFMTFPWVARVKGLPVTQQAELPGAIWAKPDVPQLDAFPKNVRLRISRMDVYVTHDRRAFLGQLGLVIVGTLFAFGVVGTVLQKGNTTIDVAYSLALTLGMMVGALISLVAWRMSESTHPPMFSTACLLGFVIGGAIVWKQRRRVVLPESLDNDAPKRKGRGRVKSR